MKETVLRRLLRRARPDAAAVAAQAAPSVRDHEVHGHQLTVRLDRTGPPDRPLTRLAVTAEDPDTRLFLRTLLVAEARLVREDGVELNVLGQWPTSGQTPGRVEELVADRLAALEGALATPRPAPPAVVTTWWTKRANFGDLLGPVLVHRITGRPVVHSRHAVTEQRTLFTVGSVLGFSDIPGAQVWGSGLIRALSPADLKRMRGWDPPRVHAVRGRHTAAQLRDRLGWQVPDVFGDPALLAPRFLAPPGDAPAIGPVIVPHAVHDSLFTARPELLDGLTWVNPSQGPQRVIEQIASASHCLSSSLHGVLVAHAFGVPWTWLRVTDTPLLGDAFKFEDFFADLEGSQVSRLDVAGAELTPAGLAEGVRRARVPLDHYDLDRLEAAFPDLP